MPGKPVQIGPFAGGLNNVSLSGEANDTELVELVNFDIGLDRSLTSRPPLTLVESTVRSYDTYSPWSILGVYRLTTDEWFIIYVQPTSEGKWDVIASPQGNIAQSSVIKSISAVSNIPTDMVQIDTTLYFSVGVNAGINGFKWSSTTLAEDIPTMPKGNCLIAFKSRLWLAGTNVASNSSRIWFSEIGTNGPVFDNWIVDTDFIDVGPGQGGFITSLLSLNSSILIFKTDGTWRFSYPSSPSQGQVTQISTSIGTPSKDSVIEHENYVYVYDQGKVYELVNNNFRQLNRNVKFEIDEFSSDGTAPSVNLSIASRRIFLRYYNSIYVYGLDTNAWSQWRSNNGIPGSWTELPGDSATAQNSVFIASSKGQIQAVSQNLTVDPTFSNETLFQEKEDIMGYGSASVLNEGLNLYSYGGENGTISWSFGPTADTSDSIENVSIPVGAGQRYTFSIGVDYGIVNLTFNFKFLLTSGLYETVTEIASGGLESTYDYSVVITTPDNAISMTYEIVIPWTNEGILRTTLVSPDFRKNAVASSSSIIRMVDEYEDTPNPVEHIVCRMRTKAYDYQAPSVMKRLFWWGLDTKTDFPINTVVHPIARKQPITWGELSGYTHTELKQGTWGNPLDYLTTSISVADINDPENSQTDNGRLFMKIKKGLRFRQVYYAITMKTLGNKNTGPAKLYSLTTYVDPKQTVVDSVN